MCLALAKAGRIFDGHEACIEIRLFYGTIFKTDCRSLLQLR